MFELTINEKVYQFCFGMGFMLDINKEVGVPVDGLPGVSKNIGLRYYVAGIIDNDLEALCKVLLSANKNQAPRITDKILYEYIDDPDTDIDKLFKDVLDFLSNANATKKTVKELLAAVENQKNK